MRDPLGRETLFTYDEFGRQVSRELPEGETESFAYDELGRQKLRIDFAGRVTEHVYDDSVGGRGRLAEKRFFDNLAQYDSGAGTPTETVAYLYDGLGRVSSQIEARGTTTYEYNADGQTTKIASPEGILRYEFDEVTGQRTRAYTTDATGEVINDFRYTYDAFGRLKTVTVHERNDEPLATPEVTSYQYDLVGNLQRTDLPNGVIEHYEYDALNRLDKLTHYAPDETPENLADNDKIVEFDYDVRADGKRTGVTETYHHNGSPQTIRTDWSYDNAGRLIEEVFDHYDNQLDQTSYFKYDLNGNRLEQKIDKGNDESIDEKTTYVYDDNDRLLTEAKDADNDSTVDVTTEYDYHATEQTGKVVTNHTLGYVTTEVSFSYNLQGRMSAVVAETFDSNGHVVRRETTTYSYDTRGQRVSSTNLVEVDDDEDHETALVVESETETTYLNDPANHTGYLQILEQTTREASTGNITEVKVFTIGHDILAQTTFTPTGATEGATIVLLYDGHGSTRLVADLDAEILQAYSYDAYGNAIGFDPGQALTAILYSGQIRDTRTGLDWLGIREYDPQRGVFMTDDPYLGNWLNPQTLHKRLYVHGDPVNLIDPSGMEGSLIGKIAIMAGKVALGALVGAAVSGGIGFVDGYLARNDMDDAWDGAWNGAIAGGITGGLTVGLGGPLGAAFRGLPLATKSRWLKALFAVGLAATGYRVATSESVPQALFRGGTGALGLLANAAAIHQLRILQVAPTRYTWRGPSIQSGVGQTALRDRTMVNQIRTDMLDRNYRFDAPEGRIGGWRDADGNYYIGEGHHRMNAALDIFELTGNDSFVNRLLQNGLWTPGKPPTSQIGPLPRN